MRSSHLALTALAALLVAAPAAAAATPPRSPAVGQRIINGHAPSRAWPAQVSVQLSIPPDTFVCGGTLVSARWILTAGHCATNDAGAVLAPGAITVNIGGTTRTNGTAIVVDNVIKDPSFTPQTPAGAPPTNDVALLHLAAAAPPSLAPMRMITSAAADTPLWSPGVSATIIGWGVTETGLQSPTLLEAQIPIVSDAACLRVPDLNPGGFDPASMVCAGGGSTDTCGGDSGGPLMVAQNGDFTVAGLTSWGVPACGTAGDPGVYTRLGAPAINAWVRSNVPTVAIGISPAAPAAGDQVTLSADVNRGAETTAPTSLSWDLNDDGVFGDATGPSTSATFSNPAGQFVRFQAVWADGDRATTRDPVLAPVASPPPPPPPPAAAPAPAATPEQIQQVLAAQQRALPIGGISVRTLVKLKTLRGANGIAVAFQCRVGCNITGQLKVSASTARRYGLRSRTIGSGSGSLAAAGNAKMAVRLTPRAKTALRHARSLTATLATTLSGDLGATVQGTQQISFRR